MCINQNRNKDCLTSYVWSTATIFMEECGTKRPQNPKAYLAAPNFWRDTLGKRQYTTRPQINTQSLPPSC